MADVQNVTPNMGGWMGSKAQADDMPFKNPGPPKSNTPARECINVAESNRKNMMNGK